MSPFNRKGYGISRTMRSGINPENKAKEPGNAENVKSACIPILEALDSVFLKASSLVQDEIQRLREGRSDQLSKTFFTGVAAAIYRAEQQLWQLADGRQIRRESVLLQIARGSTGTFVPEGKEASKRDLEEIEAALLIGVEFRRTDEALLIRMPYLPPRGIKRTTVATDMLAAAILHSYDQFPKWKGCSLKITHVYPTTISRMPKDVDNYDYKRVIDLVCYGLGASDCAAACSVQMDTLFTDDLLPGTYILAEEKLPKKFEKSQWTTARNLAFFRPTPASEDG